MSTNNEELKAEGTGSEVPPQGYYQAPYPGYQGYQGYVQYPYAPPYPYYPYRPAADIPAPPTDMPAQMYSPGLFADMPLPRDEASENDEAPSKSDRPGTLNSLLRAVCLVLVCVLSGTVTAYAVTNYRFDNGDFTPTQVVLGGNSDSIAEQPQSNGGYTAPLTVLPEGELTAQDIYNIAIDQVVGINITTPSSGAFGYFESIAPSVSGSGFIISSDGYILTNYHVIEMAHDRDMPINIVLHDGSSYDAEVVGFDASSDVAVVKIEATGLSPAVISDSDALQVGQTVYAVGNPFGDLVYTMTDGIVSALDRVVTVEGKTINTFQFSAAVNSGNSGGPVYNTRGEVIGIVTAKVIRGNVEGIGFAIPINDAIDIAAALIEHGYISGRPLLGITVQPITSAQAEFLEAVIGVFVREVAEGSAAETAGIETGDIITAIADEQVVTLEDLRMALRNWNAGDTTTITVWRNGDTLDLEITFDEDLGAGRPESRNIIPDTPGPFENMP